MSYFYIEIKGSEAEVNARAEEMKERGFIEHLRDVDYNNAVAKRTKIGRDGGYVADKDLGTAYTKHRIVMKRENTPCKS